MKIISKRDLFISTTGGTSVRITAGVSRETSDEIGLLALQQGAEQFHESVHGAKAAPGTQGGETVEPVPFAVPVSAPQAAIVLQNETVSRESEIVAAIEKIVLEGSPDSMTISGRVKAQVLNEVLDYPTTPEERDEAWKIYITR